VADVIFWIVVAVVGLSLVAATLIIRYGKKELPPGEPREAIEAPQETPTEEEASPGRRGRDSGCRGGTSGLRASRA